MDELTRAPERILIDCLRALDGGAASDDCLTRYPQQADSLRGVLDMRAQLLTLKTTAPSPATFASGREALLARVVRPLASSHPGSMETEGRPARGLFRRPATRAAFAGALLFAVTSCAIGVSATPAGDKVSDVLPNIPTIDVPDQRPIYPFPEHNDAPPGLLPTAEPTASEPVETAPQPIEQPQSDPAAEDSDSQDGSEPADEKPEAEPAPKPSNPGDTWLPPINAQEDDPPDITTPEPPGDQENEDASDDQDDGDDEADSSSDSADGHDDGSSDGKTTSDADEPRSHDDEDDNSPQGETSADAATSP